MVSVQVRVSVRVTVVVCGGANRSSCVPDSVVREGQMQQHQQGRYQQTQCDQYSEESLHRVVL